MRVTAIVNPASANGRTARRWRRDIEPLVREAFPDVVVAMTQGPGEATQLSREAVGSGVELVVAVGGDGTLNEIVNGMCDTHGRAADSVALGVVPCGTGGDFAKTLGIPRDPRAAVGLLRGGGMRTYDVGRICVPGMPTRYFANIADLGVGGALVERLNRSSKALGGFASYLWHLLAVLATYAGREARVVVDGETVFQGTVSSVVVANGQYFGGGMHVAPAAQPDDGQFDVVIIEFGGFWETVRSLPLMYQGRLGSHPRVHIAQGQRVEVTDADGLLMDVDGEHAGRAPVIFEIVPRALRICSPAGTL